MSNLNQNHDVDGLKGTGKIVGIAITGVPILGKSYIVEPDISISNDEYPYSHFVVFESFIKTID